ncbi:MAG: dethiobiotin synthase [Gammaproteobacteria bacterium]|nr:dethiobiotin synthase [Gammaproteobacteria bacterium]
MSSLFVTGTDTGVGKTWVTCALIRQFIAEGLRVVGMKPVASGAEMHAGRLRNEDALQLMRASNVDAPYEYVNPYCFAPPIAPHLAAKQEGIVISIAAIQDAYQQLSALADVVVVEGVGGWLVPISDTQTMADLVARLDLPVVMVVGMRLGCLNHALLTAAQIQQRAIPLRGWIANTLDPAMPVLNENIDTLNKMIHAPMCGVMPYLDTATSTAQMRIDMHYLLQKSS